jgi:acyl-CoA hydrolase
MTRADWDPEEICSGYFFMVAVDDEMKPTKVPQLSPSNDEEQALWDAAQQARDAMR